MSGMRPGRVPERAVGHQAVLRSRHLAAVLERVADAGPQSRARLAAATGLTKATVSSLVDTLIAGGLLSESGRESEPSGAAGAAGRPGRPGRPVGLAADGPVGIGIEINVDYLSVCTVDLTGTLRHQELIVQDFRGVRVDQVLDLVSQAAGRALASAAGSGFTGPDAGGRVAGVAVAVPGLVDAGPMKAGPMKAGPMDAGRVLRLAPNLGWRDIAVATELRNRAVAGVGAGLPIVVENEANLAALGELWCGGHPDLSSFVCLSGEIGVGAGIVLDRALFRGTRGFSGEIGHVAVPGVDVSAPCRCGASGCLEQAAGQEAILRGAGLSVHPGTTVASPGGSMAELLALARGGDRAAVGAIEHAGRCLGIAVAGMLNLLDISTVVLGGIYAPLAPWLAAPFEQQLNRRVLAARWAPPRVLVSTLLGEAAVRGAATSVVRSVIADPAGFLARSA